MTPIIKISDTTWRRGSISRKEKFIDSDLPADVFAVAKGTGIIMKTLVHSAILVAWAFLPCSAGANPYLAKPGEAAVTSRVAACAITGGFIHLYTALDNGLFDKYGIKVEFVSIRGSGVALAALAADEIQFLYCAADATIPGMAAGSDAKLIAAPLVGLPWVMLARKDIKRVEDLKGKSIAVTRAGDLTFRLARALLKKFNLTESEVKIMTVGGTGQIEPFNAMQTGLAEASLVTPPLDVRGRRGGFNLVYRLNDLGLPAVYSSLHTNAKTLRERPLLAQKWVAALAESLHFVERNPDKGKAAVSKALKLNDADALQSAYDAYAKLLVNRRLTVPESTVAGVIDVAREQGTNVRRKAAEMIDNHFADDLDKSGFLKEIWGAELPR
jgi:NitT/TauT family transport system substrate-binding protein